MYKDVYIGNAQYNWSKLKAGTITLDRNVPETKMADKTFL